MQFTDDIEAIKEAIINGDKTYLTKRECAKGHMWKRYVKRGTCYDCSREYSSNYHVKNKTKYLQYDLKRMYGLTIEQRDNMLKAQNNLCLICKNELIIGKFIHIDHCKETKIVRGILCNKCNQGIGLLQHNPKILRQASLYCEKV